jgi:hypothetical protein
MLYSTGYAKASTLANKAMDTVRLPKDNMTDTEKTSSYIISSLSSSSSLCDVRVEE